MASLQPEALGFYTNIFTKVGHERLEVLARAPRARCESPWWILFDHYYPEPRLLSDDLAITVIPYTDPEVDPEVRFLALPPYAEFSYYRMGWQLYEFFEQLLPNDKGSQMLREPLFALFEEASENYYQNFIRNNGRRKAFLPFLHFARLSESMALGCSIDRIYRSIGLSYEVLENHHAGRPETQNYSPIVNRVRNGRIDLDLVFISLDDSTNPDFILNYWNRIRSPIIEGQELISPSGEKIIYGRDYQMIERVSADGQIFYEGWRLLREKTEDDTDLIVIQTGIFSKKGPKDTEYQIEKNCFSVEISALPESSKKISPTNRRAGRLATSTDKHIWWQLRRTSFDETDLVVDIGEAVTDLNKYGRNKWYILVHSEVFEERPMVVEVLTRAIKQMALRVGAFDVTAKFAKTSESHVNESLWWNTSLEAWSEYLVLNLLGAAHLSPLVLAANLVPNSRLDDLPIDLRMKLATHGIDYSLSLGNLWPEIFGIMSQEQIIRFLTAIPDQEIYIRDHLKDLDRYEQSNNIGELEVKHQGLYYLIEALRASGINVPDFNGNILMQALYIFRHPDDFAFQEFYQ